MHGGVPHGEDEGGEGQTLEPDALLPGLRHEARHARDDVGGSLPVKVNHTGSTIDKSTQNALMTIASLVHYAETRVDQGCVPVPEHGQVVPHGVALHQQPRPPVAHLEVEAVRVLLRILGPGLDEETILEALSKHQPVNNRGEA